MTSYYMAVDTASVTDDAPVSRVALREATSLTHDDKLVMARGEVLLVTQGVTKFFSKDLHQFALKAIRVGHHRTMYLWGEDMTAEALRLINYPKRSMREEIVSERNRKILDTLLALIAEPKQAKAKLFVNSAKPTTIQMAKAAGYSLGAPKVTKGVVTVNFNGKRMSAKDARARLLEQFDFVTFNDTPCEV